MMLKILRIVLTVVGFILVIDCIVLMAYGATNFGTIVPFLIGLVFIIHGLFWQKTRQFFKTSKWLNRLWYGLWGLFGIWLISFIWFAGSLQTQINQTKTATSKPVDAILVLGAGTKDNKPSKTLAKRLDAAVPIINAQPKALVITSGGIGLGDKLSSGQIMANYLHDMHGIALSRIAVEGASTSTEQNFSLSVPLMIEHDVQISDPVAVVTSDFHIIRSKAIAKHQGFSHPIMVASPTPLSIRYNAWFREYFAFVSGWLLNEY